METATLGRWGNSQGIRIPKAVIEQLSLKTNDKLNVVVEDGQMILRKKEYDLFDVMFKDFDVDNYFAKHGSLEENFGGDFGKEII